jgi:hypothetical protein
MAVKMMWDVTPCRLTDGYQQFISLYPVAVLKYDRTIFNSSVYMQQILCILQYHFTTCFGWIQPSSGVPELKLCPHTLK